MPSTIKFDVIIGNRLEAVIICSTKTDLATLFDGLYLNMILANITFINLTQFCYKVLNLSSFILFILFIFLSFI